MKNRYLSILRMKVKLLLISSCDVIDKISFDNIIIKGHFFARWEQLGMDFDQLLANENQDTNYDCNCYLDGFFLKKLPTVKWIFKYFKNISILYLVTKKL